MAGQRDRFLAEALHEAAVSDDHVSIVIDEIVAEPRIHQTLGERHADGVGNALTERSGSRLHTGRVAVLGMPRRLRSPLPECFEFIQRHAFVARQVQERIQQHRAVTGRQHEAIAIRPCRVRRIEFEESRKQHGSDVGHAHGHARMTGLRLLDRIDRQKADRVGHFRVRNFRTAGNSGSSGSGHIVRLLRSMSCRISGVRMSCIARSSFAPWITIELARDMKLCGIIDSR